MNNSIYPITEKFEKDTENLHRIKDSFTLEKIRNIFISVIKEYEHGCADVEDVEDVNLKQYSAVANDLLLCIEDDYGEDNES